jgi:hypothetical protein
VIQVNANPAIDTAIKLVVVAIAMFAFVFVVMVPLYDVLCDALGINGKTSGEAYTSVPVAVDESRTIKIQFVATNNEGMPWEFGPSVTAMKVHPGAVNDTVFYALYLKRWLHRQYPVFHRPELPLTSIRPSAFALTSSHWMAIAPQRCLCSLLWIRAYRGTYAQLHCRIQFLM